MLIYISCFCQYVWGRIFPVVLGFLFLTCDGASSLLSYVSCFLTCEGSIFPVDYL